MRLASPIRSKPLIRTGKYGERGKIDVGGAKSSKTHKGNDIRAAVGTPFYPMRAGKVIQTIKGWTSEGATGRSSGSEIFGRGMGGNQVVIEVRPGLIDNYAHALGIDVNVGDRVGLTTQLGRTGKSGGSKMAPHLHVGIWELRRGEWVALDPTMLLPWEGDTHNQYSLIKPKPGESIATPGATPTPIPTTPTAPVETAAEREERELMSAAPMIIQAVNAYTDARLLDAESKMRADTRGFFTLDMGDNPGGDIGDAEHCIYIGQGRVLVMQRPVDFGVGQIASHASGSEATGSDYRLIDAKRPTNRMTSQKFWNAVKDALMGFNYFGDDREVTVQDAKAWVAKWEQRKADEATRVAKLESDAADEGDIKPTS